MSDTPEPVSAARLAELLGDRLPSAGGLPPEAFELVRQARSLIDAVVMTDLAPERRAAAAQALEKITAELREQQRPDALMLVRHEDGRIESLLQAGSGRLNPQAPPLEWIARPTEPPTGSTPQAVEIVARCTFGPAYGGSPGRVYGGVLALVLDEALGVAVRAAGATGMTVGLNITLKGATPLGVPVDITARYTGHEGRKSYASGEIRAAGTVTTQATAVFVSERRAPA